MADLDSRPPDMKYTARRFTAAVLGAVFALACVVGYKVYTGGPRLPALTAARFTAAREKWQQLAPPSYDIEIVVSGRQPATYRVETRDNAVVKALRNGQPLTNRRTFETWSVPGMFNTIAKDVENLERVASGRADATTPRLLLRAIFNRHYAYPERYLRIEMVERGENPQVSWQVTEFSVKE